MNAVVTVDSCAPDETRRSTFARADRRVRTAASAAPDLSALVDGDARDPERDCRVGPPQTERGVEHEADEDASGQVGAEHVLRSLASGRSRTEAGPDPLLGTAEQRHD